MPEIYTTPFVATTNGLIASSDHNASYGGNIRYYRQFLTNPDGANQWLQSTSVDDADWVDRATAVIAALGFTPPRAATPLLATFGAALVANGSGCFEVSPAADGPSGGGAWYLLNVVETNQPTAYALQLAVNINDQNDVYLRLVIGGVGGAWRRLWHAGNDGPSSGLDADTVDGLHAADIASAGAPAGLVAMVRTAAEIPSGWSEETALRGRTPIGAGTTFSQTFVQATDYGSTWAPSLSVTGTGSGSTTASNSGDASTFASNNENMEHAGAEFVAGSHTHAIPSLTVTVSSLSGTATGTYIPPMRAYVYVRKS